MNLYLIKIWGPCDSEEELRPRLDNECDHITCVTAPSINIADQMCYLVSTRNSKATLNHQETIQIANPHPFMMGHEVDVFIFKQNTIAQLRNNPVIRRPVKLVDRNIDVPNKLYQVSLALKKDSAETWDLWAYTDSAENVQSLFMQLMHKVGIEKMDKETCTLAIDEVIMPYVFWKPDIYYP